MRPYPHRASAERDIEETRGHKLIFPRSHRVGGHEHEGKDPSGRVVLQTAAWETPELLIVRSRNPADGTAVQTKMWRKSGNADGDGAPARLFQLHEWREKAYVMS